MVDPTDAAARRRKTLPSVTLPGVGVPSVTLRVPGPVADNRAPAGRTPARPRVLMRELLGESLREHRSAQGRTLRDISHQAQVSLGYLSEVERGQKEASSELLASICTALGVPMSAVLHSVGEKMAAHEQITAMATLRLASAAA